MMNNTDGLLTLTVSLDGDVVQVALVLDASESARDHRETIASLALQTIQSLPATVNCSVFFLGNPAPYPGQKLARNVRQWFDENARRASLIGPVVRGLATGGLATAIGVIGSGLVYDLEDWTEPISQSHLTLMPVTGALCANDLADVSIAQNVEELLGNLYDPVVEVDIAAPGMMPLQWTNNSYRLQLKDGEFHLMAEAAERFDVCITCESLGLPPKNFLVQRRSGTQNQLAMSTTRGDLRQADTLKLSESEADIFRQAIRRQPLKCPQCAQLHSWDTMYCNNTCVPKYRFKGFPLYPSLENRKTRGLVVCRPSRESVCCDVSGQAVLRLSETSVLVLLNEMPHLVDYEPSSATWKRSRKMADKYIALTEDRYVLNYR